MCLHSCTTILLKETLNCLEILRRLLIWVRNGRKGHQAIGVISALKTSAVLDAYTSILSNDSEVELSDLYFTNTSIVLLAVSLTSSVAMNLMLSDLALDMIIAGTFGLTFVASLACGRAKYTLPFMALPSRTASQHRRQRQPGHPFLVSVPIDQYHDRLLRHTSSLDEGYQEKPQRTKRSFTGRVQHGDEFRHNVDKINFWRRMAFLVLSRSSKALIVF